MLRDTTIKTLKVKLAKVIELIVNEQSKKYNTTYCDIQQRLENIYEVLDNNQYKMRGVIDNSYSIIRTDKVSTKGSYE